MDAFEYASENTLRAIFRAICADPRVRSRALDYLKAIEPEAIKQAELIERNQGPALGRKRKARVGLSICVQCDEAFDEEDNRVRDCKYHSGELEPDYDSDIWADHDEDCHGIIDSEEMRKEVPDGFIWNCCNRLGSEEGCRRGRHQSDPELSRKGAYASESATPEEELSEASDEVNEDGGDESNGDKND